MSDVTMRQGDEKMPKLNIRSSGFPFARSTSDLSRTYSDLVEAIRSEENQKILLVCQGLDHRRFLDRWTSREVTILRHDPTDTRTPLFAQNPLKEIFDGKIVREILDDGHLRIELMAENVRRDEFFSGQLE